MNENRIDNPHNDPQNAAPNKDMTQRVRLEDAGQVGTYPTRNFATLGPL